MTFFTTAVKENCALFWIDGKFSWCYPEKERRRFHDLKTNELFPVCCKYRKYDKICRIAFCYPANLIPICPGAGKRGRNAAFSKKWESTGFNREVLRDQFSQILQQYQLMQARIRSGALNKKYVHFGFSTIVGNTVAPEICCQFLRRYPTIHLETQEDFGHSLLYRLDNGQLDVVITGGSYANLRQWEDRFHVISLHPTGMEYFVQAGHPLTQKARVTMEEIAMVPTIMLDDSVPVSRLIQNVFSGQNLLLNVVLRSRDIYTVERFISLGVGGGFLPPESGTLNSAIHPLNCPELSALKNLTTSLYWRKDKPPSYALQSFIDVAKTLYGRW